MAKINPRISCKCKSEGQGPQQEGKKFPNRRFDSCICKDINGKSKPKSFDTIFIESVKSNGK